MSRPWRLGIEAGLACSPKPTGVEYYARSLMNALVRDVPDSFRVHLYLAPGFQPDVEVDARVRVHHRPDVNVLIKRPWLVARSWLDQLDVLYSFGHNFTFGSRGRRLPTIYDTIWEELPDCYPPGVPQLLRGQLAASLQKAWAIVTDSQATAQSLRTYYSVCQPMVVTGAAARSVFCRPPAGEEPAQPNLPFFLFVGRMDLRKNVARVVSAYRQLLRSGRHCALALVGPEDSGSEELSRCLSSDGVVGESIVRPGYLEESELIELYRTALGFVYPSLAEGFGMPVLEAMACGTPTITSNRSALAEVAEDAALLVNPESTEEICQAMTSIFDDEELRARLRSDGLALAEKHTWQKSAQIFWSEITRMLPS